MKTKNKKAHTSDNILAYYLENAPTIEDDIEIFFKKLDVPETLKKWGCSKRSGKPAEDVLEDIFKLRLERISVENNEQVRKVPVEISKDCYYRFLQRQDTDWLRIESEVAFKVIEQLNPDYSEDPEAVGIFLVDDTPFKRPFSKNTEMLSKQYDHASHEYYIGGRLSFLGYVYNGRHLPLNSALVTSAKEENYCAPKHPVKEDSPAEERREIAASKMTEVPFQQVQIAKEAGIKGNHVAFDSWFSSPKVLFSLKKDDLDSIARLKTNVKTKYVYKGEEMTLMEIYKRNRFTLPPSENDERLFTVTVDVERDEESLPLKIVFCESYGDSKDPFVAIASTDPDLSDETILLLYRLRWKEEEIHKDVKSAELELLNGNQCMNLDSISAHIAIVLLLWLLAFFFAKISSEGDSIQRSFLRIGVHCANAHVVKALLSSLERIVQNLEPETELSRSRLISILTSSVLESESFEFYLQNLPLDVL